MSSGYKRETWKPPAQPTSSWTPGRSDSFRPSQAPPDPSASSSRRSRSPPAGPSGGHAHGHAHARPLEASSSFRPGDRPGERANFVTKAFRTKLERERDRVDNRGKDRDRDRDRDRGGPWRRDDDDGDGNRRNGGGTGKGDRGDRSWGARRDDDRRGGDTRGGKNEDRSWSAYNEQKEEPRINDRRRDDERGGNFRNKGRTSSSYRPTDRVSPPPTRHDRSPISVTSSRRRRESPDYGVGRQEEERGRRASPDYGETAGGNARRRDESRESSYSPIIRHRSRSPSLPRSLSPIDRKRLASSPDRGVQKRPRADSPARSVASSRRPRSPSRSSSPISIDRFRRDRSPTPPRNGRRAPERTWGRQSPDARDTGGRRPSPRRHRSPPPPPRRRSPSPPRGPRGRLGDQSDQFTRNRRPSPPPRNRSPLSTRSPSPSRAPRPRLGDQSELFRSAAPDRRVEPRGPPGGGWGRQPLRDPLAPPGHGGPEVATLPYDQDMEDPPPRISSTNGHQPPISIVSEPVISVSSEVYPPPLETAPLGPIKISFNGGQHRSPPKPGSRPINKAAIKHFFDDSIPPSPISGPSQSASPPPQRSQRSRRSPEREHEQPATAVDEEYRPPLQQPHVYLDLIAANERQYTEHLSTIAPYIQAAFDQWYKQNASPALPDFLIHYFGRPPNDHEVVQIERLLGMRTQLIKDQHELQSLHKQAVDRRAGRRMSSENGHVHVHAHAHEQSHQHGYERRRRDSHGHWSPPPREHARRRSRRSGSMSPIQQSANAIPIPESAKRYTVPPPTNGQEQATPIDTPLEQPLSTLKNVPIPVPANHTPSSQSSAPSAPSAPSTRSARIPPGEMYERLACVGEGTYGKVYKARNVETGSFVALKRIRMEGEKDGFPVTAMREIKLLQNLRNTNVLKLIEMMVSKGSVYMVLEYMDHDLTGLLAQSNLTFSPANLKSLNYQMLNGLAYLHEQGILHRDMKGSNILLNAMGELKLADFGLARVYSKRKNDDYTNRVITLWYRSPELLLGETVYGPEVDMWSAGCIMLELFTGKPIFQGNDEIHQLEVIYQIMGTPEEASWPEVKDLPWYELVKPKDSLPSRFKDSFGKWLSPAALDLAQGLLDYDSKKRLSAGDAMATAYFELEEPKMEMPTHLANIGEHHEMSAKLERHRRRQAEGR